MSEQQPRARQPSVLLVTTSYPLHSDSVSGVFVQHLARALQRYQRLQVLTPAAAGPATPAVEGPVVHAFRYAPQSLQRLAHGAGGIPVVLRRNLLAAALLPLFILSLVWHCWNLSRDKQLLFANWSVCGVIAGIVARLRHIPAVVTVRGEDANRAANRVTARCMLAMCARLCERVVTVSEAMQQTLQRQFPWAAHKIVCIPNGVADEFLHIPPLQPPHSPPHTTGMRLLCIASLIPRKSVHTALHALARLPAEFSLHIVGEGAEQGALQQLAAQLDLTDRVTFQPFLPPSRLPPLFEHSDALLLPSRGEGRPNVMLEAFAAGRPVIASDIDGPRELIGNEERGLLFPAGDSDALAAAIRRLDDPTLRLPMGRAARRFISEQGLTWDACAQRYTQLFSDLIHNR